MSVLAPWFWLGLGALSLPILLHLIRRTPQGRQVFSSLMFLTPSPPRLARRTRLDQLLLLLLRLAALTLIVLAFTRPFFRGAAGMAALQQPARHVAIVLDTSASMQREGVWQEAVSEAEKVLQRLDPRDDVALMTFADRVKLVAGFQEDEQAPEGQKRLWLRDRLKAMRPGWAATNLGRALVEAAEYAAGAAAKRGGTGQVVLISDLQRSASLASLQTAQWPREVQLAVVQVGSKRPENAGLHPLPRRDPGGSLAPVSVWVTNSERSPVEQLEIRWAGPNGLLPDGPRVPVYVPAGQSRMVRVPWPAASADRLVLSGDGQPFDNTAYIAPQWQRPVSVVYLGRDRADDPTGMLYYLRLALMDTPRRKIQWHVVAPEKPWPAEPDRPDLAIVTAPLDARQREQFEEYLRSGGRALIVLADDETAQSLADWLAVRRSDERAGAEDYWMLAELDFSHPLLAPFASPRYRDFSKVHFWRRRAIEPAEARPRVLARFDDQTPAIWEQRVGQGRVLVMASGWHPEDSQLSRSSKFVPLMFAVMDWAGAGEAPQPLLVVGDRIPPEQFARREVRWQVTKPDGTVVVAEDGMPMVADRPGIYRLAAGDQSTLLAVNVPPSESDTAALSTDVLEQCGVRLGWQQSAAELARRQRHLRDVELEQRQKLWQWCLAVALAMLIVETWLAGRRAGRLAVETGGGG